MSDEPPGNPDFGIEIEKLNLEHQLALAKLQREHELGLYATRLEERFSARHEYARQVHAEKLQRERHFKEYGQLAMRSVFLLNGGSVVVLLTFISSSLSKAGLTVPPALLQPAFGFYAGGVMCALAAITVAYINYLIGYELLPDSALNSNAMMEDSPAWPTALSTAKKWGIRISFVGAIIFGIASGACFVVGSYKVLNVLGGLTGTQAATIVTPPVVQPPLIQGVAPPIVPHTASMTSMPEWWTAWFTGGLVLATALLWIFTALLWWTTRKAVTDSAKTAEAATKAAVAATQSANIAERALVELERPFLLVELSDSNPADGASPGTVQFPFRTIELRLVNVGRMPAILTRIEYDFKPASSGSIAPPVDQTNVGGRELPAGTVSVSGRPFRETTNLFQPFSHDENDALAKGEKSMWIIGFVRYDDIFGNHYIAGFSQVYDRLGSRFVTRGDNQAYNYTHMEKTDIIPQPSV